MTRKTGHKGSKKAHKKSGRKGTRKASPWNKFVKKIFEEGRRKNKDYSFSKALSDASARKGEMKNMKE